jgi:hypothetical protein
MPAVCLGNVSRDDESRLWTNLGALAADEGVISGDGPVIVLIGRALQAGMSALEPAGAAEASG